MGGVTIGTSLSFSRVGKLLFFLDYKLSKHEMFLFITTVLQICQLVLVIVSITFFVLLESGNA